MTWSNIIVDYKEKGCKGVFIKFIWRRIWTCSDLFYEKTKMLGFHTSKMHIIS